MAKGLIMVKDKAYRLGMYEKSMPSNLSWEEKLSCCKESGFDWLEISIDESDDKLARLDWTDQQRQEVIAAMNKTGVKIKTMCLSGHRKYPLGTSDPLKEKRSLEIMSKAIDLAYDIGVQIIQLAGYDVYYEKSDESTRKRFIDNLKKCVLMAAKKGVYLGFETMETEFMDTVEKAMVYVKEIDSPYLNVYPDIGNLTNAEKKYGGNIVDDIRKGAGHIVAAHLKETKPEIYREVPFGDGHTDYIQDIAVLKELGVRMFTGEFWYTGQENWREICSEAGSFLRSKLDRVFTE